MAELDRCPRAELGVSLVEDERVRGQFEDVPDDQDVPGPSRKE